jgi:hypothetical protein
LLGGCASSPLLRAAESGDRATLSKEILAKHKEGKLSNAEAAKAAKLLATHELEQAKPADALKMMTELRGCAGELTGAYRARIKARDLAGAEAAAVLVDDGYFEAREAREYAGDADEAWRAVGVRALFEKADADARRKAMVDPSPRVRRAAMRAAALAKDAADLDVLSESARLDPEPIVRSEAVRALAMLAGARGPRTKPAAAADLVLGKLRDLWTNGDDAIREDIAVAYAVSPLYEAGGREALRAIIGAQKGPGALAGAGAVLRRGNAESDADKDLAAGSEAALVMAVKEGSLREKLHSIAIAPMTPSLLAALRDASNDKDTAVRIPALGKLLGSKEDAAKATQELERIASQSGTDAELASRAKTYLARAGHLRIQAWIEADLASKVPHIRLAAADSLSALGRAARGAPLLADEDPHVRMRAACTLITGAR